jgi:hypothetical protein
MKSQKYNFLYALIITIIVFNLGIFMGYMLESSRINKVSDWYSNSERNLLDQKVQERIFETVSLDCDNLVEENIKFADRIYEDALKIDRYEKASRINKEIIQLHKRYDLMRTLLWMNSIRIKEKCNSNYSNIVYFYKYNEPTLEQEAKQRFFSKLLEELKMRYGNKIILIPIAADNDLPSIELLIKEYEIDKLPVLLINENIKITELNSMEDVEKYLN